MNRAVRVGLATFALALVCTRAGAQRATPSEGRAVTAVVAELIAPAVGAAPERVRVEWSGGEGAADSVRVEESGAGRWVATLWTGSTVTRRYVRVGVVRDVPVAARELARGDEVAPEDVRVEARVVWGSMDDTESGSPPDPVGMVAGRRVAEGEVLAAPAVRPPLLMRGGEQVEAVLELNGVVMRMRAEALGSARQGESVYVRLTSGKRVAALAVDRGVVRLIPGGA